MNGGRNYVNSSSACQARPVVWPERFRFPEEEGAMGEWHKLTYGNLDFFTPIWEVALLEQNVPVLLEV
ncbi:hypothetical protein HYALB_00013332 [Hymenoscyphus albidus]|uniref:Uncharacterized protein n=1 Tax=Hymenoscyphus albidus TaxID=595503 RepID=A0A9N9LUP4_9HELO|nr:hypothetical protein HYALB_00013332 [Hymenoscyphus albidus]